MLSAYFQAAMETLDGIIDAVPVAHSLSPLVDLLKARGKLITLFGRDPPLELPLSSLTRGKEPNILSLCSNSTFLNVYASD